MESVAASWQFVTYMFLHKHLAHPGQYAFSVVLWHRSRILHWPEVLHATLFHVGYLRAALWLAFNFTPHLFGGQQIYASCIGASAAVLGCVIAFATLFPTARSRAAVFHPAHQPARKNLSMIAIAIDS